MLKFQHKVALITGSGTGIGKAIATKFVENGASVVILGRRREPLEETSKMLEEIISEKNSGASVRIFSGVDVSEEAGMNDMFESLKNDNVTVDYIINNAGVSGPVTCFANAPLDEFKSTIGIHLTGTFWGSVQALKVMKEGGKIITISTFFTEERPLEQRPYRFRSPYTASQGAKNRLAEAMSWELTDKGYFGSKTVVKVEWNGPGSLASKLNEDVELNEMIAKQSIKYATIYVEPTEIAVRIRGKWDNHLAFGISKELFEIYDRIAGHIKAV